MTDLMNVDLRFSVIYYQFQKRECFGYGFGLGLFLFFLRLKRKLLMKITKCFYFCYIQTFVSF